MSFRVIEEENGLSRVVDKETGATITVVHPPSSSRSSDQPNSENRAPQVARRTRTNHSNTNGVTGKSVSILNKKPSKYLTFNLRSSQPTTSPANCGSSTSNQCGLKKILQNGRTTTQTLPSLLLLASSSPSCPSLSTPTCSSSTTSSSSTVTTSITTSSSSSSSSSSTTTTTNSALSAALTTVSSNHIGHHSYNDKTRRTQQKYIAETVVKVEFCSALGQKMLLRVPDSKYNFSIFDWYKNQEKFCSTENRVGLPSFVTQAYKPRPGSKARLTRSNVYYNGLVIPPTWGPRSFVHTYTFTKAERLEKWYTLESGLNWKGRLNSLYCKRLKIIAPKLLSCPLCKTHLGRTRSHCCSYDKANNRISNSTSTSTSTSTTSTAISKYFDFDHDDNTDSQDIFADLKDNKEFINTLMKERKIKSTERSPSKLSQIYFNRSKTNVIVDYNHVNNKLTNGNSINHLVNIVNNNVNDGSVTNNHNDNNSNNINNNSKPVHKIKYNDHQYHHPLKIFNLLQ